MSAALTVAHAREICHTLDSQLKDMTNQVENLDATTPDVISGNLNVCWALTFLPIEWRKRSIHVLFSGLRLLPRTQLTKEILPIGD